MEGAQKALHLIWHQDGLDFNHGLLIFLIVAKFELS